MTESMFLSHSLLELIEMVRRRTISIEDMARTVVATVEAKEATTLAWVSFSADGLLSAARAADAKCQAEGVVPPLGGLPFAVKDIFNTRRFPTQMGSPIWAGFNPGNDARVVDSLTTAGALVAGKTVTAEFAVHALNETLNPHDPTRTPGTSSSGSAAAVATGMVPFALATQTAGSIVRPASFCGVWGMKPSFGLIPRTGVLKTTDSLDTIGFVAAHAKSLRPILDRARVTGPDYPFVYRHVDRFGPRPKAAGQPWRVGFVRTHTWGAAEGYAQQAVEQLVTAIAGQPGFEVDEVEWPSELGLAHEIHSTIYAKSLSYYFKNEKLQSSQITPIMRSMMEQGEAIDSARFAVALRQQERLSEALAQVLSPYDIVVSLGTGSVAPPRGEEEVADPSLIWTLAHVPAVAVPAFRGPGGLPFSAQIVSRRWYDYGLLQAVEELVDRGVLPAGSQAVASR